MEPNLRECLHLYVKGGIGAFEVQKQTLTYHVRGKTDSEGCKAVALATSSLNDP